MNGREDLGPGAGRELPRPEVHKWRRLFQVFVLALAVYILLPQITTFTHSMDVLRSMKWWAVGLAVAAQMMSYVGSGYLVAATAGLAGGRLSARTGVAITLGSTSIGLVAGGTFGAIAAAYHWMRERGINAQAAWLGSSLPALFFNNALMFLAAVFGLIHLFNDHALTPLAVAGFGLAAAFLLGIAVVLVWGVRHQQALARLAAGIARRWAKFRKRPFREESVAERLEPFWTAWHIFRSGGWFKPVFGACLNVGFDMLTLYLLFIAAGELISPGALLVGYGLPHILARFAFLPGGIGVVEASMAALYHSIGVSEAVSVVVIMGYRGLSFWLPTLIGFPMAAHLERSGTPVEAQAD